MPFRPRDDWRLASRSPRVARRRPGDNEPRHHAGGTVAPRIANTFIVVATLTALNDLVNAASDRVPLIERLVSAPPLTIVRDGELLRRNVRREFITEEELMSHLRLKGIDDVRDVKIACVEREGKITAVRRGG